jgi:hypothetical protein
MGVITGFGTEGGQVEGVYDLLAGKAVFARHGFNVAIVTAWPETVFLEDGDGFRVRLFDVADDHLAADELIKSEHRLLDWSVAICRAAAGTLPSLPLLKLYRLWTVHGLSPEAGGVQREAIPFPGML